MAGTFIFLFQQAIWYPINNRLAEFLSIIRGESLLVDYGSYITSAKWERKRQEFFQCCLFEGFCAGCGIIPEIYNIHHLTYERLGEEYLEDLIALCQI